jgi:MFS family permease
VTRGTPGTAPIRRHDTGDPGADDTGDPGADDTGRGPGQRGAAAALLSVCLGFFVIQLDVTIVNVALPAIQHEIGGSLAGLQWVIDAYTLALASIMLTAGSAADRIGARKIFVLGLTTFAVGSAACAAAPTLSVLIAARAVQGLGASALLPCSLALLVHQFPDPRARARALGVWGGMGSLGVALGPVLGGALVAVAVAGWRSIFVVNVPVCLLTVALLRRYVRESPLNPARRTDVPGLVLGVLSLAGFTASFIIAGQLGWLSPLPGTLPGAGVIAAWCFVRAERRQAAPMLPLGLFRSRSLSGATGIGLIFNLVLYGALLCLSLFLQQVRHESVLTTWAPAAADEHRRRRRLAGQRQADGTLRAAGADDRRADAGGRGHGAAGDHRDRHVAVAGGRRVALARPVLAGHAGHDGRGGGCRRPRTRRRSQRHPQRRPPVGRSAGRGRRLRLGPRPEPARPAGRRDRRLPDRGGPGLVRDP